MTDLLQAIDELRVHERGERRAPHKPLLLLMALAAVQQGRPRLHAFKDLEGPLTHLLDDYAPPVRSRHDPTLPYWHLKNDDGLWSVEGEATAELRRNGKPRKNWLRHSRAGLPEAREAELRADPGLLVRAARRLLDQHFPPSLHEDVLASVGLELEADAAAAEPAGASVVREVPTRDPNFRVEVLRAYEYRCAVTGFRAALSGTYFGVEAAHVQWHAYGGPDRVSNGIALNPLMHKLFDRGAWTLDDERRVVVSANFTGDEGAEALVRGLHGKPVREPLAGYEPVGLGFVRWHREAGEGGVFRQPALGAAG